MKNVLNKQNSEITGMMETGILINMVILSTQNILPYCCFNL